MKNFFRKIPLLFAFLGAAVFLAAVELAFILSAGVLTDCNAYLGEGLGRLVGAAVLLLLLMCISGKKSLGWHRGDARMMIVKSLPYLIPFAIYGVIACVAGAANQPTPYTALLNLPIAVLFCLSVGLLEEFFFRAILNDAIVYQFRSCKHCFGAAAWTSALLFGLVHVIDKVGTAFSDPYAAGTFVLKFAESGLFGLILLFFFWKTRSIWACAILHAVFDFLPLVSDIFTGASSMDVDYVSAGEAGKSIMIVYGVIAVLEVIVLLRFRKKEMPSLNFEEMRQTW